MLGVPVWFALKAAVTRPSRTEEALAMPSEEVVGGNEDRTTGRGGMQGECDAREDCASVDDMKVKAAAKPRAARDGMASL